MMAELVDLESWKGRLQSSSKGVKANMTNMMMYVQNVRELGPNLRWNEFANRPEWFGKPILEHQAVDIRLILEKHNFDAKPTDIMPAVMRHCRENPYHPVRDYLETLVWDGTARLDHWSQLCLGATNTAFARLAARKTLIAAIARAYRPGCKVDTMLVLEGPQGLRKSSAIKTLFGADWTAESVNLFDQHNKMVMSMMGAWVVELAEFVAIQRKDQNTVKGVISMGSDRVVLPYAKAATDHPRQCVFIGTINPGEGGYLTDSTGNRRYWPLEVTKVDLDLIASRRDQLWAEAKQAFEAGEPWWMTGDEEALAKDEVANREKYDVWDEVLTEKLADFDSTTLAAAMKAIGIPTERMDDRSRDRITASLKRIGFISDRKDVGKERGDDNKRRSVRIYRRVSDG